MKCESLDWNKIKTEYITTNTSYRKLAAKYGTTPTVICVHSKNDGDWHEQRAQFNNDTLENALKNAEKESRKYRTFVYSLAFEVAKKLKLMIKNNTLEQLAAMSINPKSITGAVKDIADVLNCKSDADKREQEARITNLLKQANDTADKGLASGNVEINFTDDSKVESDES